MHASEAARLAALHSLGVLDTPREDRFDRMVRLARRVFDVPMAAITLIDEDRQWHKANAGFDGFREGPRDEAFCSHTVEQPEILVVPDATRDARFAGNPQVVGDPHIRFYAGEPLRAPGGERVGALCLVDTRPHDLGEPERALLREMADWVERELAHQREMDHAVEVQRLLLPAATPPLSGYELAGRYLPARQVGGDFFDWYLLGDRLQIEVADVMGKGLAAAIIASSVRAMLRGGARFNEQGPAVTKAAAALEPDLSGTLHVRHALQRPARPRHR